MLGDINEQNTSFLNCKHKHMMKSGAPPDKFGVLYRMVTYRIPRFHKQNYKDYHSLVPGLISIFLETVWVPLKRHSHAIWDKKNNILGSIIDGNNTNI